MSHNILKKLTEVDSNNSDAVKEVLATFVQNLSKHVEYDSRRWLSPLGDAINRFPKYCISHRGSIESYLIKFIDSRDYHNTIEAAKCIHALQQVRPSQEKTATPKSSWRDQMTTLCNSAHKLIDSVFSDAIDIYKQNNNSVSKPHPTSNSALTTAFLEINSVKLNVDSNSKQNVLIGRLRNVFIFIQAMLVEAYPVAKPVQPQLILDVVVRALSVTSSSNNKSILQITSIKTHALRILDALVLCLRSNLIPYSPLVFRIIMQTLRWSSENMNEPSGVSIRELAYKSISGWLNALRSHNETAARRWPDELASFILEDITHKRQVVELTMNSRSTKNLSKKAKRKLTNTMLQESSIASHMPGEMNKNVCQVIDDKTAIAALECAETFLTVCGVFLKPEIHKQFQERLVRECYSQNNYSDERQVSLLRVLEACRKTTPPTVPPPTQYCLQLYSAMVNHRSREISKFCSESLLNIRMHLYSSPPSLNYALQVPQEKQTDREERKKMSDRNRSALEALLGQDRMPPSHDDEIIDLAEEPSNKKPRLEDEFNEKISISSGSESSVEICDDGYEYSNDSELDINEVAILEKQIEISNENAADVIEENDSGESELDMNEVAVLEKGIEITKEKVPEVIEDNKKITEKANIYEAATQIPANNEVNDEPNSPLSMEVAYDYPNTNKETVAIIERMDEENLPSTNDTDDVQITCGQTVRSSQDLENKDGEKNAAHEEKNTNNGIVCNEVELPKVNGVNSSEVVENGTSNVVDEIENEKTEKMFYVDVKGATVEDMLADFVDEVNDIQTET